jgi:hypothetical protein
VNSRSSTRTSGYREGYTSGETVLDSGRDRRTAGGLCLPGLPGIPRPRSRPARVTADRRNRRSDAADRTIHAGRPADQAGKASFAELAQAYSPERWIRFHGKPLVYIFGAARVAPEPRFSIIRIDNGPSGDQYWVANPPNIKYGFITLTASFTGDGLRIDPRRTGDALDQQVLFAETNKDRTKLLLWHSWNIRRDGSALLPSLATGSANSPAYAFDRVKAFNEHWKRP